MLNVDCLVCEAEKTWLSKCLSKCSGFWKRRPTVCDVQDQFQYAIGLK